MRPAQFQKNTTTKEADMSTFGPEMCDLSAGQTCTVSAQENGLLTFAAQISDARRHVTKTLGECVLNK